MRVLVTGDRGYIGSVLVPILLKNKYDVVGLDSGFFDKNLFGRAPKYKKINKDIRKIELFDLKGIDAIIHLSALSNDPMGEIDPALTEEINFKSSVRLAKMAKRVGACRFLFSSSCSIYGIAKNGIVDEKSKVNPLTAYAKSKIETEKELIKLADSSFCVGILRNSTVYGFSPNFRDDLVVNNLVGSALSYGQIRIMSDGTPWRPLIDVRDLARIFTLFLIVDSRKINGKIINIGFAENNLQIKDIATAVQKHVPNCQIVYTGEHGKDTRSYKVSFKKFKSLFPKVRQEWDLDKSIKDMIKNLKRIKFNKKDFDNGKFVRLTSLKKLMSEGKIDKNLYLK